MKIGIIADIHDNLINLEKFLKWSKENKIDRIFCCGDVTNWETIKYLSENFSGEIHIIRGNMDIYYEEELEYYKNYENHGRYGSLELAGYKIGLCHEPDFFENVKEMCECEIVFYGHTHKPFIETRGKTQFVNPGTLGGVFQRGTFAVWDTENKKLELKMVDDL